MRYAADKYYEILNGKKVICVDFDNTVCLDEWPYVGPIIPGAIEVLKALQSEGHKIILYTQRSYSYPICCNELVEYSKQTYGMDMGAVDILSPAIKIFTDNGISLWGINQNNPWEKYTGDNSRKVFMDYLIDDHVVGTDRLIVKNSKDEDCKIVNWKSIDDWCLKECLYNNHAIENNMIISDTYIYFKKYADKFKNNH